MALDVSITTPLADALEVAGFSGEEAISQPFLFHVDLTSVSASIDFTQIVGKPVAVKLSLPDGEAQYLNGIVTSFGQGGQNERGAATYYARVEPWLALLRMNVNYRIFQNLTVPQIIDQSFTNLGLTDYKNSLTGTYEAREYCVQYGETTLDFVSRLMESEGIFYFFTHTADAHTMVLADDASAFADLPGIETIRFDQTGRSWETIDAMTEGAVEQQLVPAKHSADDFNFVTPATDLLSISQGAAGGNFASVLSIYEYPGLFQTKDAGEAATNNRLSSHEVEQQLLRGSSMCRAFHAGYKFTLAGHYRTDANVSYVLRSVRHELGRDGYSNSFVALPASVKYRPAAVTPKARIYSAQTAIVVGKSGEEIWTDRYGRIKVKFHWDQSSAQDETSSCWIRVAQTWAGAQWGSIVLPRIGQEVLVSFLDGDPDRPIVTGCVYNGQQTTPYTLPDNQTRTTIKSNSSKGGSGFNELRFEDKAGSEEVFLQAQKDMNVSVLNDQSVTVTNNRSISVSKGNETHNVQGTRSLTVAGDETHTNSGKFTQTVSGDFVLNISGNLTIQVSGSVAIQSGTSFLNKSGTSLTNQAGTSMSNEAQVSIASKANASHSVESSGILELKGSLVKIN